MPHKKMTVTKAFKELGRIDKKHESGKYTKKQHDAKSKQVLRSLARGVKHAKRR